MSVYLPPDALRVLTTSEAAEEAEGEQQEEAPPPATRRPASLRPDHCSRVSDPYDVIVVGGGFAGVTAARECAQRGRRTLLLEARDRLGGRTWSGRWHDVPIEYGGAWVHWHQPHTFSELTRAGLTVSVSDDAARAFWYVGGERRSGPSSSAMPSPAAAGTASSTGFARPCRSRMRRCQRCPSWSASIG